MVKKDDMETKASWATNMLTVAVNKLGAPVLYSMVFIFFLYVLFGELREKDLQLQKNHDKTVDVIEQNIGFMKEQTEVLRNMNQEMRRVHNQ